MKSGKIIQLFVDVNLGLGHDGLADIARSRKIYVSRLSPGEYVAFVNVAKDKVKLYAANNVIAYLRLDGGRKVDWEIISSIPKVFGVQGRLESTQEIQSAATGAFVRPIRKSTTILELARARA